MLSAAKHLSLLFGTLLLVGSAHAAKPDLPPEAAEGLRLVYDGDPDAALPLFRNLQSERPDDPLGFLLEAEALWWKNYCQALEVRYGFIGSWKRPKRPEDDAFFALADKIVRLAESRLKQQKTAPMHFYAGMGYAFRARMHALREERLAIARAGVKGREHLLRAVELDPNYADAYTGLGLYNYYVDTLSGIARLLRFFMGIPGGNKKEGIQQLEKAVAGAGISEVEARFYLAINLRDHDRQYERALELLAPLAERYPHNPLYPLLIGNLNTKLNRQDAAADAFRAAERLAESSAARDRSPDPACAARLRDLARSALASLTSR